jgi:DNA repair photolyase
MVAHRGRANMIEQMFEMAHRVRFVESECKSALTRVQGMPFQWSLNPYRGCSHACPYCCALSTHSRMDREPGAGFDREIEVKTNFPAVLERALWRARDGAVAIGTATDPYQPCEGRYRVTRRAPEALARLPLPLSIRGRRTSSTRSLRRSFPSCCRDTSAGLRFDDPPQRFSAPAQLTLAIERRGRRGAGWWA